MMKWLFVVLCLNTWTCRFQSALGSRSWISMLNKEVLIFDSHRGSILVLISSELVWRNKVVKILLLLLILAQYGPWLPLTYRISLRYQCPLIILIKLMMMHGRATQIAIGDLINGVQLILLQLMLIIVECCIVESSLLTDTLAIFAQVWR